jgi:hypothetical protein
VGETTISDDGRASFDITLAGEEKVYSASHTDVSELARWHHCLRQLAADLSKFAVL